MGLQELLIDYNNYNDISAGNQHIEPYFKNVNAYAVRYGQNRFENITKNYTSDYKCVLNTELFPDMFTARAADNMQPELGLMFIKTYLKLFDPTSGSLDLLDRADNPLNLGKLYELFNQNQELVEMPYPIALYIGGLYYFNSEKNTKLSLNRNDNDVFSRINNIDGKATIDSHKNDCYNIPNPKSYMKRVLNRSIYPGAESASGNIFSIKTGITDDTEPQEIIEKVTINAMNSMPPIGFGVQNQFLNNYNNVMFGGFLSGTKDARNFGMPHVISGGYSGIIKPLKTYNSTELEFTALYRNLFVKDYNYDINTLKTELSQNTKAMMSSGVLDNQSGSDGIPDGFRNAVIECFVAYSKLKAKFLSGFIADKASLKLLITELSTIANLDSYTKKILGNKSMSDFYYLISCIFFTSYKAEEIGFIDATDKVSNLADFNHRFSYTYNGPDYRGGFGIDVLQNAVLTEELHKLLNVNNSTIDAQNISLTDFLYKIWSIEKLNLDTDYSNIDSSNAIFALYPSAGGPISPNGLITNSGASTLMLSNRDMVVAPLLTTNDFKYNPKRATYLWHDLNDTTSTIYFDNSTILKNTTRFLWFDGSNMSSSLIPENINDKSIDSTNKIVTESPWNYFTLNYLNINPANIMNDSGLINYMASSYKIANIMDSFDFEKLEEFKSLFIDFCTFKGKGEEYKYTNSFNLKGLMLASSVVSYNDISPTNGLTKDQITLLLIGNSMYQYDFFADCGISKILNTALTQAQSNIASEVITEFCSSKITIANFSTLGSIKYGSAPKLEMHKFTMLPEILIANSQLNSYADIATIFNYDITQISKNADKSDDLHRYFSRKILFGDQYIEPFVDLNTTERNSLLSLIEIYVKSTHPTDVINNELQKNTTLYSALIYVMVRNFFKFLNIKYSDDLFKLLIKFIRTYVSNNLISFYGGGYFQDYSGKDIHEQIAFLSNVDASFFTSIFFKTFVEETVDNNLKGINTFLGEVSTYFTNKTNPESENSYINKSTYYGIDDIKKSTYYNIKHLHDTISGVNRSKTTKDPNSKINMAIDSLEKLSKIGREAYSNIDLFYNYNFKTDNCYGDMGEKLSYDLYQIFQVVDRGNNDIGKKVLVNLGYFYDNLYAEFTSNDIIGQNNKNKTITNLTAGSFQGLFSGLAQQNGFLFQQIPNYLNLNSALSNLTNNDSDLYNVVDHLFGVHTDSSLFGDSFLTERNIRFGGQLGLPGYIFQLGSITSNLDTVEKNIKHDYLNSFCLDIGYNNNGEVKILSDNIPEDIEKSNITCFTVDMGIQNQQMFNNIELDTSQFYNTEESIKTWVDLVNKSTTAIETSNLFPILEKRSYSVTISGLGNATIQPLTYFYLRNVPLFYGTYWITNVSHKIHENTMSTTFKGVRQPIVSKHDIRKQLLDLMKEKADLIRQSSLGATKTITEGVPDTTGKISIVSDSSKPYGEVAQDLADGGSDKPYAFDAQTIIGAYIYSITKDHNNSPANIGIIATLYNLSKGYTKSVDHSVIIKNMINIVIGKIDAKTTDIRYILPDNIGISLSYLWKESGHGFSTISKLNDLLVDISKDIKVYNEKIKLDKTTDTYSLASSMTKDSKATQTATILVAGTKIVNPTIIPISESILYLDLGGEHTNNEIYKKSSLFLNLYEIFNGFDSVNNSLIGILIPKLIKNVNIKFLGTYYGIENTVPLPSVAFFSTSYNGKYGELDFTPEVMAYYKLPTITSDSTQKSTSGSIPGWVNPLETITYSNKNDFGVNVRENGTKDHDGVDLYGKNCETNVYAVLPGVVVNASNNQDRYGYMVIIKHVEHNISTGYAHLCEKSSFPKVGSTVNAGDIIGLVGGTDNTGSKYATHLHFEIRNGLATDNHTYYGLKVLDPRPYLDGTVSLIASDTKNSDYWKLVTICAGENYLDNPQGMADVAQSIYNRLNSGVYQKSLTDVIMAKGQYEPTKRTYNDWLAIDSKETAINAFIKTKNVTNDVATKYIDTSISAINNTVLTTEAARFVGSRTEFLLSNPTDLNAVSAISREPKATNNTFFWNYNGKTFYYNNNNLAATNQPSIISNIT